jgi:hypothetical protein
MKAGQLRAAGLNAVADKIEAAAQADRDAKAAEVIIISRGCSSSKEGC